MQYLGWTHTSELIFNLCSTVVWYRVFDYCNGLSALTIKTINQTVASNCLQLVVTLLVSPGFWFMFACVYSEIKLRLISLCAVCPCLFDSFQRLSHWQDFHLFLFFILFLSHRLVFLLSCTQRMIRIVKYILLIKIEKQFQLQRKNKCIKLNEWKYNLK